MYVSMEKYSNSIKYFKQLQVNVFYLKRFLFEYSYILVYLLSNNSILFSILSVYIFLYFNFTEIIKLMSNSLEI